MSLFPIAVWRPSPKDAIGDFNPIQYSQLIGLTSAAGATIASQSPPIPADKVLLPASIFFQGIAGAGQTVSNVQLRWGFLDNAGAFQPIGDLDQTGSVVGPVAGSVTRLWIPGPPGFPIMQGQVIEVRCAFSAAGVANTITGSINGVLIPRGNWQRAG